MTDRSDDAYDALVFEGFRDALRDYAESVVRWRTKERFSELRIRIWISSAPSLTLNHKALHDLAELMLSEDLPGAVLDRIYFAVDLGTSPPEFAITIEPEPTIDAVPTEDMLPPGVDGWLVMSLEYQSYRSSFHLAPSSMWLPFGRGVAARPGRIPVRISNRVHAVPRGGLLLIRRRATIVQLRRSAERPEYSVWIDGAAMRSGDIVEARPVGTIEYSRGSAATTLGYRLRQEA